MKSPTSIWRDVKSILPLIAILRGIKTSEALAVAQVLQDAGFRCLEVPLNSPNAFGTIELLAQKFGDSLLIGAGTVLTSQSVDDCVSAGGQLIVAPNLSVDVAESALRHNCIYCPGVATPSEAFSALRSGASALKLFPAEMITPPVVKAMRAVLPVEATLIPVGGISPDNMSAYRSAGANGFGLGSGLFKPGKSIEALKTDAQRYVEAWVR